MRFFFANLCVACLLALAGCAANPASTAGTPQNPPFPRTASILPLANGNQWVYSYTAYDSAGNVMQPGNADLHLSIAGEFGLQSDTMLVTLDRSNYATKFPAYVYKFEWEEADSGSLVVYRDRYPLGLRGLYVVGEYRGSSATLYKSEKLWLAYPADSGTAWTYYPDTGVDSADAVAMEVVSTHERFFVPDPQLMTAGAFYDCYLYKESNGTGVDYYYYNPDIGCVGYCRYLGGKLRTTYILKTFSPNENSSSL
jgi:hypothetical protein